MLHIPKHVRDGMICSSLADNLREQYGRRSVRVIKGDNIRVMRGEYTGIEGKIEKVNTRRGTLAIEGVQREKVRGGNVKVQIDASKVQVIGLKLEDKLRDNRLHRNKKNPEKVKLNTKKSRKIVSRTKKSDKDRELKNG